MVEPEAVVLIRAKQGKAYAIAKKIQALEPYCKKVCVVAGPYDIIALISATDIPQLGGFIVDNIQTIDGVAQTLTLLNLFDAPT